MSNPNLKLGAQLYTLRDYTKNAKDYADTIRRVAAIGYKYVQVSGVGEEVTPQLIKDMTDETGVRTIITHYKTHLLLSDTDRVIDEHKQFGALAIGIGGCPYGNNKDAYLRFCDDYAPVMEKIKKAGMVFAFHNHRAEFEKYDGKYGLEIVLENSDPDALKLTFDTFWATTGGVDAAQFILDHGDRIFCTHLKDMCVINNESRMTEMLTGNINFDAIMDASLKVGLKWHFVEQDNVYMDAFESMKISHDNLKARYDME